MDAQAYEAAIVEVRTRYENLIRHAAKFGINVPARLDPAGIDCSSGTSCCAGDDKALDARNISLPVDRTVGKVKEG